MQRDDSGGMVEIAIGRQQDQVATQTELGHERVDGAQLDPTPSASIAKLGGLDVVAAIRDDHGKSPETLDQDPSLLGSADSLQQLLEDQARRQDGFSSLQGLPEAQRLRAAVGSIPAKGQGPDASIDKEAQSLLRSDL
ncbi:MAG: hypothetical protein AAGD06_16660 [Acidobacteriota bacterium]